MTSTIDVTGKLVIDDRARQWCTWPYPDHPKGCPMYNTRPECPPQAPHVGEFIDLSKQHWMVIEPFDIAGFAERRRKLYPDWTEKQCRNPRHWQSTVRKQLHIQCRQMLNSYPGTKYTLIPEAMGVHVFRTVRQFGIPIKKDPRYMIYKIGLVGYAHNIQQQPQRTLGEY